MVPQMVFINLPLGAPLPGPRIRFSYTVSALSSVLWRRVGLGNPQQRDTEDKAQLSWPWGHREGWVCLTHQGPVHWR